MSRMDAESVYFEPCSVWLLSRPDNELSAPLGLRIHAKIGRVWKKVTLLPNDGEDFGGLCARIGQWYAEDHDALIAELFASGSGE